MSNLISRPPSRWLGVVSLLIFGALVAWDFSVIRNTLDAIVIGIAIAAVFVLATKSAGIEAGWPKS